MITYFVIWRVAVNDAEDYLTIGIIGSFSFNTAHIAAVTTFSHGKHASVLKVLRNSHRR